MKLIQLNIWGGKLGDQVIELLNSEKPDFVCMQEVNDLDGDGANIFTPLNEIQKACDYSHKFVSPTYSFNFMEQVSRFGNAVLSKYPFDSTKTVFIRGEYKDNFAVLTDDYNIRNLQVAKVSISGKTLVILNHHGMHIPHSKDGSPETEAQMWKILGEVGTISGPIIFTGDLNLAPTSQSVAILDSKLINLVGKYELPSTYTVLSKHSNQICDYIFVNDKVIVNNFYASDEVVSDHKALILDFDV